MTISEYENHDVSTTPPGGIIQFVVDYPPVTGNKAVRHARGWHYVHKSIPPWQEHCGTIFKSTRWFTIAEPCRAIYRVNRGKRKGVAADQDNLAKVLGDMLQKIEAVKDDRLIRDLHIYDDHGTPPGKVHITLMRLAGRVG